MKRYKRMNEIFREFLDEIRGITRPEIEAVHSITGKVQWRKPEVRK